MTRPDCEELRLSHREYGEMMEQWGNLSTLTLEGSVDCSAFLAWAIERFGLERFKHYRIVIDEARA